MFGRRPAATAGEITSSDAPSNISIRTCESDGDVALSTGGIVGAPATAAGAPGRGPRTGAASDSTIVDRQNRGADASAAAAEMREPEAEKDHRRRP